jgi:hypothetical protein
MWLVAVLVLNMLSQMGFKVEFGAGRYLHVLLAGNIPCIVLSGTIIGMLMKRLCGKSKGIVAFCWLLV